MTVLQRFVARVLLLLFGVPAVFGTGMHFFLPHGGGDHCCVAVACEEEARCESACCEEEIVSPARQERLPGLHDPLSETHHADSCPVCFFCSTPKSLLITAVTASGPVPVWFLGIISTESLFSCERASLSARGPPVVV
ncbi:MAG: hypothetical protein Q4G68_06660 [Planctomycetia bacterium]|nr:hypothetical protein [Planctomycetia bacterium]